MSSSERPPRETPAPQGQESLYLVGLSDSAPPPPPSPEKTRREPHQRERRLAANRQQLRETTGENAKLELEVEHLLDNATQWRRTRQLRIRTPVRRAVLGYSMHHPVGGSSGGVLTSSASSGGRRHAVLRDLSARVRELEVDSLSRSIACSLTMKSVDGKDRELTQSANESEQLAKASFSAVGSARLDPRVRKVYQELMPRRGHTIALDEADKHHEPHEAHVTTKSSKTSDAWPQHGRNSSCRRRLQSVRSRATEAANAADATINSTDFSHSRPVRRVKTSFTVPTSVPPTVVFQTGASSSRLDLLRLRQINGEVQRSLYTERTHGLRSLLHTGEESVSYGAGSHLLLGGLVGIGGSALKI